MTSLARHGKHWRISQTCADLSARGRGDKTLLICTFNDWGWHLEQIVELMKPLPLNIDIRFKKYCVWLVLICPPTQLEQARPKALMEAIS